ncbi:uncharacterized protein N7473_011719 [Penicillium subrubescens]|uniref:uncharacterized protein n=1 Tax=Penicillium subrubescens TaxID=1316194 RepID=UPI002545A18F|nr:uncharacterized protein N7473_011719 [Penicillium subrubescens]KAJ5880666.1 hypothetical protein N7473_011719 [Penicillium subrubescens]
MPGQKLNSAAEVARSVENDIEPGEQSYKEERQNDGQGATKFKHLASSPIEASSKDRIYRDHLYWYHLFKIFWDAMF